MSKYKEVGGKYLDKYDRNVGKAKKKIKLSKAEKKLKLTKTQKALEYADWMMSPSYPSQRMVRRAMLKDIARQKKKLDE